MAPDKFSDTDCNPDPGEPNQCRPISIRYNWHTAFSNKSIKTEITEMVAVEEGEDNEVLVVCSDEGQKTTFKLTKTPQLQPKNKQTNKNI